ncbi:MAG: sel1 repeat family protein [Hyphomicrobium sp.]|uniref:sel1 repeat family protein n=1 Tax=Hyphomicrobium sp. TaxID=82 RepID=UPI0039E2F975
MSGERREGKDPLESGDDTRDELKSMLDVMASQLQDADRRHMAALNEMQDKIAGMGREADTLRARIPDQFAPAFERIEAGIGELAHRLADAAPAANVSRPRKVAAGQRSGAADPFDPWDQESADAFAGHFAPGGAVFPAESAGGETSSGGALAPHIDETWIENRFAEIVRGLEYSLANLKPDKGLSEITDRFDHFERQFSKLFEGVATHDDCAAVQQVEKHMDEMIRHLEKTNVQLDRLETIETKLGDVSKTLAELQTQAPALASGGIDVQAIVRAAAEETAQRFAKHPVDHKDTAADELRPLIEQLMSESRHSSEQTAAILDTMQQAMVRLIDRVDAIEAVPMPTAPASGNDAVSDEASRPGAGSEKAAECRTSSSYPGANSPVVHSGSDELDIPLDEMVARTEKLRQEFAADARRAKMRLGSDESDILEPVLPAQSMPSADPTIAHPGSRPIRPSARAAKNMSGPSAPSPRLMLVAGLVFVLLAGLWYTFGFEKPEPSASSQAVSGTTVEKSAPVGAGTSASPSAAPSDTTPATNGPRGDLAPNGSDDVSTAASDDGSQPRTALPMLGVAVDLDRPVTEEEMQQARRHQAMANISGELGSAMSRPGESASVPSSMVPTEAETEGNSARIQTSAQNQNSGPALPQDATRSGPVDMPSAMVGPLSLRLAASNGDPSAQFEVGARFAEGEGVKQNFIEAAKWYQRSADQGFAQAQYRLGTLYERGLGLKPDRGQAASWYQRAAEQGNIKAMHNLAVLSANQNDRSPDYATAAKWFEQAARRGLPDSEFNLAVLYENGLGVPRDMKQAFMWVSIAARAGDADAIRRRDILRGKLTAQEISDTEKMIAAWRIVPTDRTINDALVAGEQWKKNPKNGVNG